MGNYLRMQMIDRESLCQNIYADEIIRTVDYLKEFEAYAKAGKKTLPVACYTNFRDSLFHFRKMANCAEEHEIMQQAFAVKEHLQRSRTDAMMSVVFYFSRVANCLIDEKQISFQVKKQLRILLHKMKNVVMLSRLDGMMMSEAGVGRPCLNDVATILENFFDLVQDECFLQFSQINDKLGKEERNCL